jgi:LSD1 subclass zinc finger protein
VSSTCELCQQPQDGDAYLCEPCVRKLGQQLAEELVPLGSNWPRGNGGHGTQSHAPLPLAEHPLVLRAGGGMVSILEDWRMALHDDCGWSAPVIPAGAEPRIRAAVQGLTVNLPWISERWPQAGTFAAEIRNLYREVTSITAPAERPGVRVGYCPAVYDGVDCRAVLHLQRGKDTIRCNWCDAEYPQVLWLWLRSVQDDLGQAS